MNNELYNICPYISDKHLKECLEFGEALEEFAYEKGYHENGYSPIKTLYTVIMHMSADYEQFKDHYEDALKPS
jgi:hypothetical protein